MNYRLLEQNDFNKGFVELLGQLTEVGDISKNGFMERLRNIMKNSNHRVYVLEQNKKIVSCATLLLEPKFIHDCGFVGHIEDVVVDKACRGQNLGRKIIDFLTNEAEKLGCYKILLDCSDNNVGFYEKCEYMKKGAYMAKYLNPKKSEPMTLMKYCKNNRNKIIGGVFLLAGLVGVGLYLYHNYNEHETKEEEDKKK